MKDEHKKKKIEEKPEYTKDGRKIIHLQAESVVAQKPKLNHG